MTRNGRTHFLKRRRRARRARARTGPSSGRVYDPTVGRFLGVDPIVRDATASQSWNGYGYVEGRVLSATDPTGWSTDNLKKNTQHRADPPRSAWVTSVYGTFHQSGEWGINPDTGIGELITTGYWSFSNPYSLVGLHEPSLRVGEYAAPARLANEDAGGPPTRPQGEQPADTNPCNFSGMFAAGKTYPITSRFGSRVHPITGETKFHESPRDFQRPRRLSGVSTSPTRRSSNGLAVGNPCLCGLDHGREAGIAAEAVHVGVRLRVIQQADADLLE